jgi:hypothetical protein
LRSNGWVYKCEEKNEKKWTNVCNKKISMIKQRQKSMHILIYGWKLCTSDQKWKEIKKFSTKKFEHPIKKKGIQINLLLSSQACYNNHKKENWIQTLSYLQLKTSYKW